MNSEDKAELLDAIFSYQNWIEVWKLSYAVSLVFDHMISYFEKSKQEYEQKCEQQRENAKKRWKKEGSKKGEDKKNDETTPLSVSKDWELLEIVEKFVENKENYHQIQYQIKKNWKEAYIRKQYDEAEKLVKIVWWKDNLKAILQFCLLDDFRKNQILSIKKLRDKNKDKVPYYEVIIDKIKTRKPQNKVAKIPTV